MLWLHWGYIIGFACLSGLMCPLECGLQCWSHKLDWPVAGSVYHWGCSIFISVTCGSAYEGNHIVVFSCFSYDWFSVQDFGLSNYEEPHDLLAGAVPVYLGPGPGTSSNGESETAWDGICSYLGGSVIIIMRWVIISFSRCSTRGFNSTHTSQIVVLEYPYHSYLCTLGISPLGGVIKGF